MSKHALLASAFAVLALTACSNNESHNTETNAADFVSKRISFVVSGEYDLALREESDPILIGRWSSPSSWGRWTRNQEAGLRFTFDDRVARIIEVETGALISNTMPNMDVNVYVNELKRTTWSFTYPETPTTDKTKPALRSVEIRPDDYDLSDTVTIMFEETQPRTPADIGGNPEDIREFGLAVFKVRVLSPESEN